MIPFRLLEIKQREKNPRKQSNKFMELYNVHTHQILLEETDDPYHSCILDVYPLEFEVAKETVNRHAFSWEFTHGIPKTAPTK